MFNGTATPRSGQLRLAIISTYDDICHIAGYTRALEQQLRPHAEVTVFDLDQYLLRSPHRRVQSLADHHIKEIASKLHEFDSVNIQVEYGMFGRNTNQIVRRLKRLVKAAPAVCVTFHSILGHERPDWAAAGRSLITGRIFRMLGIVGAFRNEHGLGVRIYRMLRAEQRKRSIKAIVHTKRDARLLQDVFHIREVAHHPLSFIDKDQAAQIRKVASRDQFPILRTLPTGSKLIGCFGFLSPSAGFDTAVRALHYLPEDHHLLICGGVHPQDIRRGQSISPYVQSLLDEAHIGHTILDTITAKRVPLSLNMNAVSKGFLIRHPKDLHHRVHFLGVHSDERVMGAMALCDMIVLPSLEGQLRSETMAIALEIGCRVLASRTSASMHVAKYHPGQIEFFDVGNYAELADLIRASTTAGRFKRSLTFNTQTNATTYLHYARASA